MTIMSGRMGEDAEAIKRRWPFPDPPLKMGKSKNGFVLDEKLRLFDDVKKKIYGGARAGDMSEIGFENLTPEINQEFNPFKHEQMK